MRDRTCSTVVMNWRAWPPGSTRGLTLSFAMSEAATVQFTVRRRSSGRRVRGRCVARTRANRRRRACTRQVRVGREIGEVAAGAVTLRFTARVNGRALRRGKYVLSMVAVDAAGNVSRTVTARFTVTRR